MFFFNLLEYTRDKCRENLHVKAKGKCIGWRLLSKMRLKKNSRGSISNQTFILAFSSHLAEEEKA